MNDTVLKLHDINPDGLRIVVDWGAMVVGSSIFIPCVNTTEAIQQVKKICVAGMVIGLLPVKSYLPSPPTVLSPLRGRGFLL